MHVRSNERLGRYSFNFPCGDARVTSVSVLPGIYVFVMRVVNLYDTQIISVLRTFSDVRRLAYFVHEMIEGLLEIPLYQTNLAKEYGVSPDDKIILRGIVLNRITSPEVRKLFQDDRDRYFRAESFCAMEALQTSSRAPTRCVCLMFFNGNGAAPERNSRIAPGNFVIGFSLACWTQWTFFGVGANEALELHDAGNWLAAVENTVVLFLIGIWLLHAGWWKWTGGILAASLAVLTPMRLMSGEALLTVQNADTVFGSNAAEVCRVPVDAAAVRLSGSRDCGCRFHLRHWKICQARAREPSTGISKGRLATAGLGSAKSSSHLRWATSSTALTSCGSRRVARDGNLAGSEAVAELRAHSG